MILAWDVILILNVNTRKPIFINASLAHPQFIKRAHTRFRLVFTQGYANQLTFIIEISYIALSCLQHLHPDIPLIYLNQMHVLVQLV